MQVSFPMKYSHSGGYCATIGRVHHHCGRSFRKQGDSGTNLLHFFTLWDYQRVKKLEINQFSQRYQIFDYVFIRPNIKISHFLFNLPQELPIQFLDKAIIE